MEFRMLLHDTFLKQLISLLGVWVVLPFVHSDLSGSYTTESDTCV